MKNSVVDEPLVKISVMNARIDPKVLMDLSIFKIGGWNLSHTSNQHLLESYMDGNEACLSIGIPNRGPFFVTQDMENML